MTWGPMYMYYHYLVYNLPLFLLIMIHTDTLNN